MMKTRWILILLCLIIPLGLSTKFYSGPGMPWVRYSSGGIFYEIFWCLLIYMLPGEKKPFAIALSVFSFTSILEVMQLWHPYLLEKIRGYFIGRALIGDSFTWSDFIYYFIYSIIFSF